MNHDKLLGIAVVIFAIFIIGTIGWFMNLVKLVKLDFQEPYKAEIIRGIGLIPVVGAVAGYIDIKD